MANKQQQQPPFNGRFSGTTQVCWYQKGKTNLDFTEPRDIEWQSHQLGHMQVCTSLQTDDHASNPSLGFYRPDALPVAQPTASKHCGYNTCNWQNGTEISYRLCRNILDIQFTTTTETELSLLNSAFHLAWNMSQWSHSDFHLKKPECH